MPLNSPNQESQHDGRASKTVRLLLVEDSDSDAFLIMQSARELAYNLQVQRFVTVVQAMAALEAGLPSAPDGVFLDLNLPGGSGLDVLRFIRQNQHTRQLRVVVLTSSSFLRDREAAERLGVEGYLSKPNDYGQFVKTVGTGLSILLAGQNR